MERTFRPKGTSVKAVQVTFDTADYAAEWCAGQKTKEDETQVDFTDDNLRIKVPTLNGVAVAKCGDYILRVKGEGFKVMDPAEFEHRYEPVRNTRSDV